MKFQLLGDWPVAGGSVLIPAGTELDGNNPQWRGIRLPMPMPLNAKCLDQEAYDAMVRWYEPQSDQLARLIHYSPNVKPRGTSNG